MLVLSEDKWTEIMWLSPSSSAGTLDIILFGDQILYAWSQGNIRPFKWDLSGEKWQKMQIFLPVSCCNSEIIEEKLIVTVEDE